jgi:Tfp pilus assembly protein PilX
VTTPRRSQAGATLLVTLIMLIMLTLFAVSAMNTSTTNLQVVGNMQTRSEALESSRSAIEQTMSSSRFIATPANAIPNPCGGVPNKVCTDMNGDGKWDYETVLDPKPTCVQARIVKVNELKILSPTSDAVACLQAQQQGTFAVAGAQSSGDSLCGETTWEINAETSRAGFARTAKDNDVSFGLTQGVAVRMAAIDVPTACP